MVSYITGSKGFIGRYLVSKLDSIVAIPHQDIDKTHFSDAERVYFCSTYGNMFWHNEDEKIIKANVSDLISVLSWIDWKKIKSFVYMSTSSVKLKHQTMYSRTKRASEEILLSFMEKYNAPISIIRPTSVYGCHEQPQHLIPTILRSCFEGEAMNFVSKPFHDYIFVEDLVDGIMNLSDNHAKGIFELGTGIQASNQEILNIIEGVAGKRANINVVENMRSYDSDDWVSDNFKSRSWGWLPKITLKEGLARVVEDYIGNPKTYAK